MKNPLTPVEIRTSDHCATAVPSCLCTYVKVGYYSYAKDVTNSIISITGVNILKN